MTTAEEDAAERERLLAKFPDRSSGDIHFDKPLFPPEPAFPPPNVEIEIVLPPRDRPADPQMAENAERIGIAVERMKVARAKGIVLPPLRPAAECEIEAVERLLPFKRYRWEQERRARGVVDLRPRPDPAPKKRVAPIADLPQFHVYVHPRLTEILAAVRGRGPSVARDDGWPGQAGPSRKIGEGGAQAEGENRASADGESRANAEGENHAHAEGESRANAEGENHVEARAEGRIASEAAADCIEGTHFARPDRIGPIPTAPTFPIFSTSPGLTGGPMVKPPQRVQKEHRAGLRLTWKQEPPKPKPRFHPNGMLIIDETSVKPRPFEPVKPKPKPKLILLPK